MDFIKFVYVILGIIALLAMWKINNLYFDWLHRSWPEFFRPKVLFAIIALCVTSIAFGLWINPPSKMREEFHRAHPELGKPAQ